MYPSRLWRDKLCIVGGSLFVLIFCRTRKAVSRELCRPIAQGSQLIAGIKKRAPFPERAF